MRGIDIRGLSMRRQFNLVQAWLSNKYGDEVVSQALAAPTEAPKEEPKRNKMAGRRMTKEQAEQIAQNLADYDSKAAKGKL